MYTVYGRHIFLLDDFFKGKPLGTPYCMSKKRAYLLKIA